MTDPKTETTPESPHTPAIQSAIPSEELARLTDDIVAGLKTVYDPEIPVDIYDTQPRPGMMRPVLSGMS